MKLEDIKCIGVVGVGTMGTGISQIAALAGYKVIARDLTEEKLAKAKDTIVNGRFGMKGGVTRGKQTQEQMDRALANLTLTTKIEDLKNCDLVIETVGSLAEGELENKPQKTKVVTELDKVVKKGAIFAINSTRFTIADLVKDVERKSLCLGTHFFNPASVMKLVEVQYTPDTSEEVIQIVEGVCQRMGKTPVRVKDVLGDVGSVVVQVGSGAREAGQRLLDQGIMASGDDINTAMILGRGWPDGPMPTTIPRNY